MNVSVIDLQNSTTLSQVGQPGSGTKLGKDEFLKLLVTQLGAQNPLDPMKNEEFIAQLTGFSNLEELQNLGGALQDLVRMTSAGNAASAVSLLGKEIRVAGNSIRGPSAKIHYELPEAAREMVIEVRDKANKVVKIVDDAPKTAGRHDLQIEGLPENEELRFIVVGKNAAGKDLTASTSFTEFVDGANFSQAVPILMTRSGREVAATEIVEIFNPGAGALGGSRE
jgi:flagellar basal-body rod modification protein FlgD